MLIFCLCQTEVVIRTEWSYDRGKIVLATQIRVASFYGSPMSRSTTEMEIRVSQNLRYSNYLAIKQSGKGIPYGGQGQIRPDGDANYGFKNLKGELENLNQIPELQRDHALYELVRAINQPETGLLSVGCTSGSVHQDDGYRMSGYVEFAFNSDH